MYEHLWADDAIVVERYEHLWVDEADVDDTGGLTMLLLWASLDRRRGQTWVVRATVACMV